MDRRIFMTVAEASGDQHAAELARCLKQLDPSITLEGIGGPRMAAAGVTIHHESVGKAAMGWRGALRALEVARWMKWTKKHHASFPPDLHICVDSSAMNLPFARLARRFGVPVLYYIAPQLWASRPWRVRQVRRYVNRLACIFPFEEKWFRDRGVNAHYVGHPLFDELPAEQIQRPDVERFPNSPPIIGLLPGSRKSVAAANFPPLLEVARDIQKAFPESRFLVPTTPATDRLVGSMTGNSSIEGKLDGFDELVPRCDLCLTVSGTATVHVAAHNVPMIVVYRINPILWHLAGRWLVRTKKIAMVNILAGQTDLVPEFVPWYGSAAPVAACAIDLLQHPEKLAGQRQSLKRLIEPLARSGDSVNTAQLALSLIQEGPTT